MISTGYNGSPRGFENCCDIGDCPRIRRNMHQGEGYGLCRAVHAEANALLNCSRQPCPLCARLIIQEGIRNVILRKGEGAENYQVIPAKELEWYMKE